MPGIRWTQHRRSPAAILGTQAALIMFVVVWIGVGPGSTLAYARFSWLASLACNIGSLVAARHVAARLRPGDPARRFWWSISAASALIGVGFLIQLLTATAPIGAAFGPITAACIGAGTLLVVAVMCTYPLRVRTIRERACFWLDIATVMVGAAAFGWYFSDHSSNDLGAHIFSLLTGPVVMLVAVFAVAKLLVAGKPPFSAWTGLLGATAATCGGLVGAIGPTMLADGRGRWILALSTLGDALIMIAAWVQRLQVDADPHALERPRRRPYSTLPYMALTATFVLLAIAMAGRGLDGRTWIVMASAGLSAGLVVVRQLASFADNARLLSELDAKVRELHETEAGLRSALRERDVLAAQLREMAFQDSLTGLANRALFHDRLEHALRRARRYGNDVAVMLLDLDDFKPINDRYGHAAGDAVLTAVAKRLRTCLREGDTLARLGGDEFAVLVAEVPMDGVNTIAERIVSILQEPIYVDGAQMTVGVSVGIAFDRCGEHEPDQLLREADAAMYDAKNAGKGSYETYLAAAR